MGDKFDIATSKEAAGPWLSPSEALTRFVPGAPMQSRDERGVAPIRFGFRVATTRWPADEELDRLVMTFEEFRSQFVSDVAGAERLLGVGEATSDASLDKAGHAAMTLVANIILNLDETITLE